MNSRDLHPATRPDLNVDPSVLHSPVIPGRGSTRPLWMWIIILIIAVLYAISPLDFIPDIIPILGWIDDIVVTLSVVILALPKIVKAVT